MKKILFIFSAVILLLTAGCGGFRNEAQYNSGDWDFWMSSQEVAQFQRDQLALAKLKGQPVLTKTINGVFQGYKGIVANLDNYRRVNIQIKGPETKSYFMGPGQSEEDYLLPGEYKAIFSRAGKIVSVSIFHVTVEQYSYMGEKVHWYAVYERY